MRERDRRIIGYSRQYDLDRSAGALFDIVGWPLSRNVQQTKRNETR